jgi:hypothetical protein
LDHPVRRLLLLAALLTLVGCSSSGGGWNPLNWFAPPAPKAADGSDPTQSSLAIWAIYPMIAGAGLTMLIGIVTLLMSKFTAGWRWLILSGILSLTGGVLVTVLSLPKWAILTIVGVSALGYLVILYLQGREIIHIHKANGRHLHLGDDPCSSGSPPTGSSDTASPSPLPAAASASGSAGEAEQESDP